MSINKLFVEVPAGINAVDIADAISQFTEQSLHRDPDGGPIQVNVASLNIDGVLLLEKAIHDKLHLSVYREPQDKM